MREITRLTEWLGGGTAKRPNSSLKRRGKPIFHSFLFRIYVWIGTLHTANLRVLTDLALKIQKSGCFSREIFFPCLP